MQTSIIFRTFAHNYTSHMKYNKLIRLLKKAGCYDTGRQMGGHPLWTNPKTGVDFKVSNHGSQEVATGTLKNILKAAGIK